MSNKLVPTIYRAVIQDVIDNIGADFEEFGVSNTVLDELRKKWEEKISTSNVAEFDVAPPAPPAHPPYPPHGMHMMNQHAPYSFATQPQGPQVKSEPIDSRYVLNPQQGMHYAMPSLPGPQLNRQDQRAPQPQTQMMSFSHAPPGPPRPPPMNQPYAPPGPQIPNGKTAPRIPQVDGPSSSDSDDYDTPPPMQPPRANHPSLSLPKPEASSSSAVAEDDEAINSDLDDSDTDGEEDADEIAIGAADIVFCTYDKVARVKNKWKCVLKDGMIHINGRDYLFAKCTGEFEW